jgi:hypothetical protein
MQQVAGRAKAFDRPRLLGAADDLRRQAIDRGTVAAGRQRRSGNVEDRCERRRGSA